MSQRDIKKWSVLKNVDKDITENIKSLHIFGTNADQYIIITKDDTVYSFGSNSNGCLGLNHITAVQKPTKIEELCGKQVTRIEFSSNYEFVMALTNSGTLYSWGKNDCGQLGNNSYRTAQYRPLALLTTKIVTDVKCGYAHALALTQSGSVYMWGLEHSANSVAVFTPKLLDNAPNQKKIVSIDSGLYHALALTESGEVYFWGDNTYNTSTNRSQHIASSWSAVQNLNDVIITKAICGPNHCLLLSTDGSVYSFGANSYGQLGEPNMVSTPRNSVYPFIIENNIISFNALRIDPQMLNSGYFPKFLDIGAVKYFNISVGLTDSGVCYVWGECDGHSLAKPFKFPYSNAKSVDDVIDFYSKNKTTFKPILFGEKSSKTHWNSLIADRIRYNFDNKEFSDVTFKIGNKYIYAYKSYLIMVCDHFDRMFADNRWMESRESEIKIKDYSYDVYYAFLKYLYTDSVDIDSKDLIRLIDLANSYFEEELKQRCIELLKMHVRIDNYCDIYASAVKYNSQELKEYCNNFLVSNMDKSVTGKLLDQYAELKNAKKRRLC